MGDSPGSVPPRALSRDSVAGRARKQRRGNAVDHHVDAGRFARTRGPLESRRQLVRTLDVLAVAAECFHDPVVARRQELAPDGARGAVLLKLELMLGVPARVVPD